jgi:hypothetical protein
MPDNLALSSPVGAVTAATRQPARPDALGRRPVPTVNRAEALLRTHVG